MVMLVEVSGFEPELREPKSLVLPLHYTSIKRIILKQGASYISKWFKSYIDGSNIIL